MYAGIACRSAAYADSAAHPARAGSRLLNVQAETTQAQDRLVSTRLKVSCLARDGLPMKPGIGAAVAPGSRRRGCGVSTHSGRGDGRLRVAARTCAHNARANALSLARTLSPGMPTRDQVIPTGLLSNPWKGGTIHVPQTKKAQSSVS